jgi:hypothetical protein
MRFLCGTSKINNTSLSFLLKGELPTTYSLLERGSEWVMGIGRIPIFTVKKLTPKIEMSPVFPRFHLGLFKFNPFGVGPCF